LDEHTEDGEKREETKATHVYSKTFLRKTERALNLDFEIKQRGDFRENGIVDIEPGIRGIITL
jgi:hypothetical protein